MIADFTVMQATATHYGWRQWCDGTTFFLDLPGSGTLIIATDGEESIIGFDGCAWHTHGDIWAASYGIPLADVPATIMAQLAAGMLIVEQTTYPNGIVDRRLQVWDAGVVPADEGEIITTIQLIHGGVSWCTTDGPPRRIDGVRSPPAAAADGP